MRVSAAIHAARKRLGLDDDTARDLYARVTGKRSLRDMSEQQRVVEELRRQSFKPLSNGSRKTLDGRFAKKLQALWIAGRDPAA
jgi:phage gp16-like protein